MCNVVIVWYHFMQIPYAVPKRMVNKMVANGELYWLPRMNQWCVLCTGGRLEKVYGGERI